ncbi:hypothetical protein IFM89_038752 [Coptis chinensis]|uniref:Peptidase M50 domain-containing protein n=1 Tax=Coptis chinensis TaxID=261450 RepID=A0A835HJM2_9MAGN|nr:hypothetical protein IFM89_038752 [Coptis chinensis]
MMFVCFLAFLLALAAFMVGLVEGKPFLGASVGYFSFLLLVGRALTHEAGHFLKAYLLGILPKGYTLSSLEALRSQGSLNVQAGTAFVDFEFLEETATAAYIFVCSHVMQVNTGKVSAKMLNNFSCIALAGVATEYLLFGCAEGGLSDIYQDSEETLQVATLQVVSRFQSHIPTNYPNTSPTHSPFP